MTHSSDIEGKRDCGLYMFGVREEGSAWSVLLGWSVNEMRLLDSLNLSCVVLLHLFSGQ